MRGAVYPEHSCKRHDSHRLLIKLVMGHHRTDAGKGRLEAACRLSDVKYLVKNRDGHLCPATTPEARPLLFALALMVDGAGRKRADDALDNYS